MARHLFQPHLKVRCIVAPEEGIPITEGQVYTVKRAFRGNQNEAEACIPGMEEVPGVTLEEVSGYFRADRFEAAPEGDL